MSANPARRALISAHDRLIRDRRSVVLALEAALFCGREPSAEERERLARLDRECARADRAIRASYRAEERSRAR